MNWEPPWNLCIAALSTWFQGTSGHLLLHLLLKPELRHLHQLQQVQECNPVTPMSHADSCDPQRSPPSFVTHDGRHNQKMSRDQLVTWPYVMSRPPMVSQDVPRDYLVSTPSLVFAPHCLSLLGSLATTAQCCRLMSQYHLVLRPPLPESRHARGHTGREMRGEVRSDVSINIIMRPMESERTRGQKAFLLFQQNTASSLFMLIIDVENQEVVEQAWSYNEGKPRVEPALHERAVSNQSQKIIQCSFKRSESINSCLNKCQLEKV